MEKHMTALRFLVAAGWSGTPLGDARDPDALLYVRRLGVIADAVLVLGPEEAEAKRMIDGRVTWQVSGSVAEVVDAVLELPHLLVAG